jgi:hypothetical protein
MDDPLSLADKILKDRKNMNTRTISITLPLGAFSALKKRRRLNLQRTYG